MRYHLILHAGLRADVNALSDARTNDPQGDAAKEYVAVIKALKALQEGREREYVGKRLTSGRSSYDLRDCAQLKVAVFDEYKDNGWPLAPSHRLTYREFDPLPKVEGGRVVVDPDAQPYREVVAFVTARTTRRRSPASVWDAHGGCWRPACKGWTGATVRRWVRSAQAHRQPRSGFRCPGIC